MPPLQKGIGSVIPSPSPARPAVSAMDLMTGGREWQGYRTARAALAALLRHRGTRRLWLPAYGCDALAQGAGDCEIAWYGVDQRLEINIDDLGLVHTGDAVLIVDYFGRSPGPDVLDFAARRDVLVIEDRAHAIAPDGLQYGEVVLYSPRKLFGVGDGGILVGPDLPASVRQDRDDSLWISNDLRRADPDGHNPSPWYDAFKTREGAFDASPQAIDPRTLESLSWIDVEPEIAARKANWQILATGLETYALWRKSTVDFTPLAYPLDVQDAGALSAALAAQRIWCARHWADLPSPKIFTDAHDLTGKLLSLPLDGRYDAQDMRRIVDAVKAAL